MLLGVFDFGASTLIKNCQGEDHNYINSSLNSIDGVLYLVIYDVDMSQMTAYAELWVDTTGMGTNFAKRSTISPVLNQDGLDSAQQMKNDTKLTTVEKLPNGSLVVLLPYFINISTIGVNSQRAYYSWDNGSTW